MVHVQQEYDMLRQHCHQLESQLSSSLQEVCYLKQQHLDSQEDLAQLRATVRGTHTHTHTQILKFSDYLPYYPPSIKDFHKLLIHTHTHTDMMYIELIKHACHISLFKIISCDQLTTQTINSQKTNFYTDTSSL